jgi:hypothetical protein
MMLFERNYLGDLSGVVFEWVEVTIPYYVTNIYLFLLDEDDEVFKKKENQSTESVSQV